MKKESLDSYCQRVYNCIWVSVERHCTYLYYKHKSNICRIDNRNGKSYIKEGNTWTRSGGERTEIKDKIFIGEQLVIKNVIGGNIL